MFAAQILKLSWRRWNSNVRSHDLPFREDRQAISLAAAAWMSAPAGSKRSSLTSSFPLTSSPRRYENLTLNETLFLFKDGEAICSVMFLQLKQKMSSDDCLWVSVLFPFSEVLFPYSSAPQRVRGTVSDWNSGLGVIWMRATDEASGLLLAAGAGPRARTMKDSHSYGELSLLAPAGLDRPARPAAD